MLFIPLRLSQTVTVPSRTPSPSSVTYFMDGPKRSLARFFLCKNVHHALSVKRLILFPCLPCCHVHVHIIGTVGPSIYDVHTKSRFLTPLPPVHMRPHGPAPLPLVDVHTRST